MADQQNYSNHTRYYPLFHFVIIPLLVLNLLSHIVRLIMAPSWGMAFWVLLSVTLILFALAARLMAMKVQDRVIRLEERLRYREILSAELAQKHLTCVSDRSSHSVLPQTRNCRNWSNGS